MSLQSNLVSECLNAKQRAGTLLYLVYKYLNFVNVITLTLPSSLSSSARTPVLSVKSFTLTTGRGWVVVKSP